MDATKAGYFLEDLASYRAGEIDEAAIIEILKYFLNEDENLLTISEEDFDELRAGYSSLDEMLAYYEKVAKDVQKGGDGSGVVADKPAVTEE